MEKIHRIAVNTYLNDPDTIPVAMNISISIIQYVLLLLIKLLLNDRTTYLISTWEQMKYLTVFMVIVTIINYGKAKVLREYIYLVSRDKVRRLHIYRSNIEAIEEYEKEMRKQEGKNFKNKRSKERGYRDGRVLQCFEMLKIKD